MQNRKVRRLGFIAASAAMGVLYTVSPAFASEMQMTNNSSNAQQGENTKQFQMLMQQYYKIPSAVRTLLADNQVSIQMVDQNTITETSKKLQLGDENEACAWIPELRLLEISAAYPTAGLGHAVGHALNTLLQISSTANFQATYQAESKELPLTGAVSKIASAEEYFAEAFNIYTVNPSLLQEKCPKTYAYIEASVKQAALVKNTAFLDTDNQDTGTAGSSLQEQNKTQAGISSSEQPTAESLGTSWDTYNPDEILKLPYINASDAARNTITCADNVKSVFNGFLQLPSNVIRAFMASGWSFEIVSSEELQSLYDQYFNGQSADGVNSAVMIGLHKVYIRNGAASGSENTKYVLAYFIDQRYREENNGIGASDTDTFRAIYETEGTSWKENHPNGTAMQYFASSVNSYLNNQVGFISSRPQTAAYVSSAVNSLTENSASIENVLTMYQTSPGYSIPQNQAETQKEEAETKLENTSSSAGLSASSTVGIGFDPKQILDPQNQAKLAVVSEYWQKVPAAVQNYLGSKHVGIMMEEPVVVAMRAAVANNAEYDGHVVGVWLPDANAISIGYDMPEISLCHEVGHALDEYTKASAAPEFYQMYLAEKGVLQSSGSSNYVSSKEEYFGEAFNQYCLRKDLLKETCPQTYAYIDNIVSSLT